MKVIVYKNYGSPDVLQMEEVEKPTPKENQVLIKVHAASINASDYRMMRADPFLIRLTGGLLKPKDPRLGYDVAGRVEAVGENVKQFRPGDEVFGCAHGAFAEYALAKEAHLALKPANKSFEEAAALPVAALTALQGLRDARGIRPGQKVLIQGASGGVGTFAVQLANSFGAEVTAVCSTRNLDKDLVYLGELLEAGKIAPVIDRCYPLSEIAEAFRYMEDTHAQGKVVITVV